MKTQLPLKATFATRSVQYGSSQFNQIFLCINLNTNDLEAKSNPHYTSDWHWFSSLCIMPTGFCVVQRLGLSQSCDLALPIYNTHLAYSGPSQIPLILSQSPAQGRQSTQPGVSSKLELRAGADRSKQNNYAPPSDGSVGFRGEGGAARESVTVPLPDVLHVSITETFLLGRPAVHDVR